MNWRPGISNSKVKKNNCVITLNYSPDNPENESLVLTFAAWKFNNLLEPFR